MLTTCMTYQNLHVKQFFTKNAQQIFQYEES